MQFHLIKFENVWMLEMEHQNNETQPLCLELNAPTTKPVNSTEIM